MSEQDNVLPFRKKATYDDAVVKMFKEPSHNFLPITSQIYSNFYHVATQVRERLLVDPYYEMTNDEKFSICTTMGVHISLGGTELLSDGTTVITFQTEPVDVIWLTDQKKFQVMVNRKEGE